MAKPKSGRSTAEIEKYIGAGIRQFRVVLGISQRQLAGMIGVTSQQMHKYERGLNRIPAGSLFKIARLLDVPIAYFYDGLGEGPRGPDTLDRRTLLETTRYFSAIQNEKHQNAFSQMVRVLAGQ